MKRIVSVQQQMCTSSDSHVITWTIMLVVKNGCHFDAIGKTFALVRIDWMCSIASAHSTITTWKCFKAPSEHSLSSEYALSEAVSSKRKWFSIGWSINNIITMHLFVQLHECSWLLDVGRWVMHVEHMQCNYTFCQRCTRYTQKVLQGVWLFFLISGLKGWALPFWQNNWAVGERGGDKAAGKWKSWNMPTRERAHFNSLWTKQRTHVCIVLCI